MKIIKTKLKKHFTDNGLQMKWFAEKLGMPKQQLYQIINGYARLPKKYWKRIIIMTKGDITLADLLSDFFEDNDEVEIKKSISPSLCEISLTDFSSEF